MDFNNYDGRTFDTLPEVITGSNFNNCTFNASTRFEKCNIQHSSFTKDQYFYLSNVLVCTGVDGSTFDKSNRQDEEEDDRFPLVEE